MTDAPDGPPPGAPPLPAGWYDDPSGRFDLRYHNGFAWTGDVSRDGARFVDAEHPTTPTATAPAPPANAPTGDGGRNPTATAAMVLGIVSICLAWLPLLFVVGAILAVLALSFGVAGRRRAREHGLDGNRAVVGLITGSIGLACVAVGAILTVVLFRAVDRWENPADHQVTLTACESVVTGDGPDRTWAASGQLTNLDTDTADFTVRVSVSRTESGGAAESRTVELDDVGAGETAEFEVTGRQILRFEPICSVEVNGPMPFGVDLG